MGACFLSTLCCCLAYGQSLSVGEVSERIRRQNVTGATIITHGYQFSDSGGDSLLPLASAIQSRLSGWLLDYELTENAGNALFDAGQSILPGAEEDGTSGHVVLLFDWAPESNETAGGWGEAAGDALFSLVTSMGLVSPGLASAVPLHLIGHSFGAAVTSETVERLASYEIAVDHVTYLDPHDFDQAVVPVDEDQRLFDLGQPAGYGAAVWNGVAFADTYYQTRGHNGSFVPDSLTPNGRPVPGAYNMLMNPHLPTIGSYSLFDASGDHSYVWNCFYLGSVTGSLPAACPAPATPLELSTTGWAYSPFSESGLPHPAAAFYGPDQDHAFSEPSLVDISSGEPNEAGLIALNLTAEQVTLGRWQPQWQRGQPFNFDLAQGYPPGTSSDIVPGWSHHGGGGGGVVAEHGGAGNHALELYDGSESRIHNLTYIPHDAHSLQFSRWVADPSVDDTLNVFLGTTLLNSFGLESSDDFFTIVTIPIPEELRDTVGTITFQIDAPGALNIVDAEVRIDNVFFLIGSALMGDMDCDGDVDFDDIDEFVLGLTDPAAYEAILGVSASLKGDTDGDADLDFDDISGFVAALSGLPAAEAVPEPSGSVLLSGGVLGVVLLRLLLQYN